MDDQRTLEELDGEHWHEPNADATGLIRACYRLRKVPVGTLSNDDLRLLLDQQIGTVWLVPIALARLSKEPLAGDIYPGDLLNAVLTTDSKHWETHPDDRASLWAIRTALDQIGSDVVKLLERSDWPAFG
jgi:hypothetical protein